MGALAIGAVAAIAASIAFAPPAVAKPPVAPAKSAISQGEVWGTWPFQDTDKYIAHETCSDAAQVSEWQGDRKITFLRMCVKVSVQARCGCSKLTTSYLKYPSENKWIHGAVKSESENIACPTPIDKAVLAQCKAAQEAVEKCLTVPDIAVPQDSTSRVSVKVSCPAGVLPNHNGQVGQLENCDLCKPLFACHLDAKDRAGAEAGWKAGCDYLRSNANGASGYGLPDTPHRIYVKCPATAKPDAKGNFHAAMCKPCDNAEDRINDENAMASYGKICN